MNKLFDLRFVIGLFFSVIGLLLLVYGFISGEASGVSLNRWCGMVFTIFGIVMIVLSLRDGGRNPQKAE